MSGYHFTSKIGLSGNEQLALFCDILNEATLANSSSDKSVPVSQLHTSFKSSRFITAEAATELSIEINDGYCHIYADTPSLEFDFFDSLMTFVGSYCDQDYQARLIDSSSGGVHSWGGADLEIDFDGKNVCILGIDKEEGIHETIEDHGAIVSSKFDRNVDIVIHSEDFDLGKLEGSISIETIIIEEEYVWSYIEPDC